MIEALANEASDPVAWRAAARAAVLRANVGEVCAFEINVKRPQGARYLACPLGTDFGANKNNDAFVSDTGLGAESPR